MLFKDNQSYYGWLLFKLSFVFLLIMLFYKGFIYLYVYFDTKIKVKKGILVPKVSIEKTVHDYIVKKN